MMIEIYHLIYFRRGGNKPQYGRITYRKNWDFRKDEMKKEIINLRIPYKFEDLLEARYDKWYYISSVNNPADFIEFTIGIDKETEIEAMAICHPRDNFVKKIGRVIVEGRIKRQRGELNGRFKYYDNEPWIYDPHEED